MINHNGIKLTTTPSFMQPRPNSTFVPDGDISRFPKEIIFPLSCVDFRVRMENLPTKKGIYLLVDDDSNVPLYVGESDTDIRTNLEIMTHRFDQVRILRHMKVCYCAVESTAEQLSEFKRVLKRLLHPLYNDIFDTQRKTPFETKDRNDSKKWIEVQLSERTHQLVKDFARMNGRSESEEIEHLLSESFACKNLIMKYPELLADYKKELLNLIFEL